MPDLEDMENKVKYNDSIAGILLINPDNPTGAVYDKSLMKKIVAICEKYDLMLICDGTYAHVNYSDHGPLHLSEVIGDKVPGMALRSISKEFPWPGGRCGWLEIFNKEKDPVFSRYVKSLLDAKMLEVCSTTLPQMAIPEVYSHPDFIPHLKRRNEKFKKRAHVATEYFAELKGVKVVEPKGAFYLTVAFDDDVLNSSMKLEIENKKDGRIYPTSIGFRGKRQKVCILFACVHRYLCGSFISVLYFKRRISCNVVRGRRGKIQLDLQNASG